MIRKIADETIDDVIDFYREFILDNSNYSLSQQLGALKASYISVDKCNIGMQLIDNCPLIFEVEDMINYHEASRLRKFTWRREISLENIAFLAQIGANVNLLAERGVASLPIMTITNSAIKAIKNVQNSGTTQTISYNTIYHKNNTSLRMIAAVLLYRGCLYEFIHLKSGF